MCSGKVFIRAIEAQADYINIIISGEKSFRLESSDIKVYASEVVNQAERVVISFKILKKSGIEESDILLQVPRYEDSRDGIYNKYYVSVNDKFLSGPCYVTEFCNISMFDYPYPSSNTIKGLQVNMVDDAVKLGIGHSALNLNLPTIALPSKTENSITYCMEGEEFYFNGEYLRKFDQKVKELSDNNIIVNLILLNSIKWDNVQINPELNEALIHPECNLEGLISAFNIKTKEGIKYYKAFIEFVAERYTRDDEKYGRACGFIVGNEVDSQWVWANAGEKTVNEYMDEYAIALRIAYYATRKKYARSRVYISLDHFWNMQFQDNPLRCYKGKDIIDILNSKSREEGNFDWSVAYHPYPEDLNNPDYWNDKTAVESLDTGRITFKNLHILSDYLSQVEYLYNGSLRHIILSEQGFNSKETEESEKLQALAYALAYKKSVETKGIESFILHAHVDNKDEFGLNLGLWRRDKNSELANAPGSPKPVYFVFKDIDKNIESIDQTIERLRRNYLDI